MNRLTIHYIAIPAISVAIIMIFLTKFNHREETQSTVRHMSSAKPRLRGNTSTAAMQSNPHLRVNRLISESITHNPAGSSEAFWRELLLELQANDEFNDRETGEKLITIAANTEAPESIRKEAMADALVFIDDENYEQDIRAIALRMDLPDSLHNIILEDLLDRPQPIALPLARIIASTNGHLLAEAMDEYVKSYE